MQVHSMTLHCYCSPCRNKRGQQLWTRTPDLSWVPSTTRSKWTLEQKWLCPRCHNCLPPIVICNLQENVYGTQCMNSVHIRDEHWWAPTCTYVRMARNQDNSSNRLFINNIVYMYTMVTLWEASDTHFEGLFFECCHSTNITCHQCQGKQSGNQPKFVLSFFLQFISDRRRIPQLGS